MCQTALKSELICCTRQRTSEVQHLSGHSTSGQVWTGGGLARHKERKDILPHLLHSLWLLRLQPSLGDGGGSASDNDEHDEQHDADKADDDDDDDDSCGFDAADAACSRMSAQDQEEEEEEEEVEGHTQDVGWH